MKPIELTHPDTAKSFEAVTAVDQVVSLPNGGIYGNHWRGLISAIPPHQAERYIAFGGKKIKRKAVASEPETPNE